MCDSTNKVYFQPGDLVILNKDIPFKPVMYVVKKETKTFKPELKGLKEDFLLGIRCRWFTVDGYLQEAIFSTKDLVKHNPIVPEGIYIPHYTPEQLTTLK